MNIVRNPYRIFTNSNLSFGQSSDAKTPNIQTEKKTKISYSLLLAAFIGINALDIKDGLKTHKTLKNYLKNKTSSDKLSSTLFTSGTIGLGLMAPEIYFPSKNTENTSQNKKLSFRQTLAATGLAVAAISLAVEALTMYIDIDYFLRKKPRK